MLGTHERRVGVLHFAIDQEFRPRAGSVLLPPILRTGPVRFGPERRCDQSLMSSALKVRVCRCRMCYYRLCSLMVCGASNTSIKFKAPGYSGALFVKVASTVAQWRGRHTTAWIPGTASKGRQPRRLILRHPANICFQFGEDADVAAHKAQVGIAWC